MTTIIFSIISILILGALIYFMNKTLNEPTEIELGCYLASTGYRGKAAFNKALLTSITDDGKYVVRLESGKSKTVMPSKVKMWNGNSQETLDKYFPNGRIGFLQ